MTSAVQAPAASWECRTASPDETWRIGRALGAALSGGETVALDGELGMGKTRLVQGLAEGLAIAPGIVASPTFAIRHDHRGRLPLAHLDFYRLSDPDELDWLGLLEASPQTVFVIEWAVKLRAALPGDRLDIALSPGPHPDDRLLTWTAWGSTAERALQAVRAAHGR